jgi:hypothetical protein
MLIKIVLVLALLSSSAALASSSPETCFLSCKVLNGSKAYRCATTYAEGVGGIMVVDVLEAPKPAEQLQANQVRDCFFDAGGGVLELHRANEKTFISCGRTGGRTRVPYFCERQQKSQSLRGIKVSQ